MPVIRESSLVNFRALQNDPSSARRGELLKNVAALLGLVSDQCDANLLAVYDSVMVRLADMVEASVLAEVAGRLAGLRRAPTGIVRKLAYDEIDIARPLLARSPLLTDEDLAGIAELRGNAHRGAIAARPEIGEIVTNVIVARADDAVRRILAGNTTARVSAEGFDVLLGQAEHDREMQALVAAHPGTPIEVLEALIDFAAEEVTAKILQRMAPADIAGTEPHVRHRAMPASKLFAGYDFAEAAERVMKRMEKMPVDIALVGRLAGEEEFAESAVALAHVAGFHLRDVLAWFGDCDTDMIVAVTRALGGGEAEIEKLLKSGPLRFRVNADERAAALEAFRKLDVAAAGALVAQRKAILAA